MPSYYSPFHYGPRPAAPRRSRGFTKLWLLMAAGLLIVIFAFVNHLDVLNLSRANKTVAAVARPSLSQDQAAQMTNQINGIIGSNPGMDIAVSVQDLDNRQSYNYGDFNPFVAASISKLLTASDYLHEVEVGDLMLGQPVGDTTAQYEIQRMIEHSDNDAWTNLNVVLSHDGLKVYAQSLGLNDYDPDTNTLSVGDIGSLLGKLYKGELLNTSHTNLMLSYMQDANEDDYIVASIPAGVKVYHKAGWLVDRVHDAAIVDNGKHPYVLVIFTKDQSGTYNSTLGHQIFAQVSQTTTKVFL